MNFDLDIEQWIVIGLSFFLFVWYILIGALNRKQGIAIFRWLRNGLSELGYVSSAEWIGASNMGARLTVKKANTPFRRVEAHYLLEPREFLPYWLINRLRGKRDEVSVRLTLRIAFQGKLEIVRSPSRDVKPRPEVEQIHPDFQVVNLDLEDTQIITKVKEFLAEYGPGVEKISLRHETPQIEIMVRIKILGVVPPESYFKSVQTLFQDP